MHLILEFQSSFSLSSHTQNYNYCTSKKKLDHCVETNFLSVKLQTFKNKKHSFACENISH